MTQSKRQEHNKTKKITIQNRNKAMANKKWSNAKCKENKWLKVKLQECKDKNLKVLKFKDKKVKVLECKVPIKSKQNNLKNLSSDNHMM